MEEIVSFDCEHVHLIDVQGEGRIKAATVAIYNGRRELLYEATVRHQPGTFLVNRHTIAKNGFRENSLINGQPLEIVKAEVERIFTGKLVLHFDGIKDFLSLEICDTGVYENFDLGYFYRKPLFTKRRENIGEKISLRTLCWTFFNRDIQHGTHSAKMDALATMNLFLKHYIHTNNGNYNKFKKDYSQFANIVKYAP